VFRSPEDEGVRAFVAAIHDGDVDALTRIVDADPAPASGAVGDERQARGALPLAPDFPRPLPEDEGRDRAAGGGRRERRRAVRRPSPRDGAALGRQQRRHGGDRRAGGRRADLEAARRGGHDDVVALLAGRS